MKIVLVLFVMSVTLLAFEEGKQEGSVEGYVQGCSDVMRNILKGGGFGTDERDLKTYCTNKAKEALK